MSKNSQFSKHIEQLRRDLLKRWEAIPDNAKDLFKTKFEEELNLSNYSIPWLDGFEEGLLVSLLFSVNVNKSVKYFIFQSNEFARLAILMCYIEDIVAKKLNALYNWNDSNESEEKKEENKNVNGDKGDDDNGSSGGE